MGVNVFPSYCRVWVTKALNDDKLIEDLIHNRNFKDRKFKELKAKKLIHSHEVKVAPFKYFDNLLWVLKSLRKEHKNILDFKFLESKKISKYFEIYSKFYIGHMSSDTFVRLLKYLNITTISEDIALDKIQDDQIIVTIEQTKDGYSLIYYLKIINEKLKKLEVNGEELVVSNKDPKGFTASETKYMKFIFKKLYQLTIDDIQNLLTQNDFN